MAQKEFIDKIIAASEPHNALRNILRGRGFLVEWKDDKLQFSEDAAIQLPTYGLNDMFQGTNDINYFRSLCKKAGIKNIINEDDTINNIDLYEKNIDSLTRLFHYQRISIHQPNDRHGLDTWQQFNKKELKIPTECLETFCAYFVKALNSIGITTSSSCDGHGEKDLQFFIRFAGHRNFIYFNAIFQKYINSNVKLSSHWDLAHLRDLSTDYGFNLSVDKHVSFATTYFDAYLLADHIYTNRQKFLKVRDRVIEAMITKCKSSKKVGLKPVEEQAQMLEESVQDLE